MNRLENARKAYFRVIEEALDEAQELLGNVAYHLDCSGLTDALTENDNYVGSLMERAVGSLGEVGMFITAAVQGSDTPKPNLLPNPFETENDNYVGLNRRHSDV